MLNPEKFEPKIEELSDETKIESKEELEKQKLFEGIASSFQNGEIPAYIQGKIPSGSTYRGHTETAKRFESLEEHMVNEYNKEWEGLPYGSISPSMEKPLVIDSGKLREGSFPRQKERKENYLMISYLVDKEKSNGKFQENRDTSCAVKLVLPKEKIEKLYSLFKTNPHFIREFLQKIDPDLFGLCPPYEKYNKEQKAVFRREEEERRFSEENITLFVEK